MIGRLAFVYLFFAAALSAQARHEAWRTIVTPHFRVHYPVAYEAWATRAAARLESVRTAVVAEVGFAPETVTDVLIENPTADPNGITIRYSIRRASCSTPNRPSRRRRSASIRTGSIC